MSEAVEEAEQTTLLNLDGKNLNAMWVDEKAPLFIPNNPVHWKAHKLQVLLSRLDKQAEKNGAQFNSNAYLSILNEYTKCVEAIRSNNESAILNEGNMEADGNGSAEVNVGETVALSVDNGVSPDNPAAG